MSFSRESTRPLLTPQNRRLRHLHGIYLRNLTFERHQLKTTDDLHHSASSDTLSDRPPTSPTQYQSRQQEPGYASKAAGIGHQSRAADVFFSLHVQGVDDPVYISEVGTRSTNFDFSFFELAKQTSTSLDPLNRVPEPKRGPVLPTSSHNALMKLSNLEASIQDALATCESVTGHITTVLEQIPPDAVPEEEENVKLVNKSLAAQQRKMRAAEARRDQLQASIAARRPPSSRVARPKRAWNKIIDPRPATAHLRGSTHVFPITQAPSAPPLAFQICGLPLPNTCYDPTSSTASEDALSAALGYVAQVTNLLQFYLSVPIPYPISVYGSRSSVRDDISQIADTQRSFPLFLRGGATAQYRFEYGWFLLNKNIEALCVASGLKVVDIRHTLPNLKYLLYVCSAGTDELPERKRGGIRGLFAGKLKGRMSVDEMGGGSSAGGSRRGSAEATRP
ncbi:p63 protein [Apiospora phragmitis]|uniref:Autophagy-related protein 14 n=1 Tax=Apiospora phragmitis TaxID=2905665 RepID=A0ABR1UGR8_9PEZI